MADPTNEEHYHDADGNPCTLDKLCRTEPEWAANVIRMHVQRVAELERENAALRKLYEIVLEWRECDEDISRPEADCDHFDGLADAIDEARDALAGRGGKG